MEKHQGKNLGGIKSILVTLYSKVIVPDGEQIRFSQIILTGGATWTGVPFTLESAFWSENEKRTFNGLFYEKELEFSIPAIRKEVCTLFSGFKGKRLIALVTDMNDRSRLLLPLWLEGQLHVPGPVAGYNGYHYRLEGSGASPAPDVDMLA